MGKLIIGTEIEKENYIKINAALKEYFNDLSKITEKNIDNIILRMKDMKKEDAIS